MGRQLKGSRGTARWRFACEMGDAVRKQVRPSEGKAASTLGTSKRTLSQAFLALIDNVGRPVPEPVSRLPNLNRPDAPKLRRRLDDSRRKSFVPEWCRPNLSGGRRWRVDSLPRTDQRVPASLGPRNSEALRVLSNQQAAWTPPRANHSQGFWSRPRGCRDDQLPLLV